MVATRRAGFVSRLSTLLRAQRPDERFDIFHAQDAIGGNALADLVDAGRDRRASCAPCITSTTSTTSA
jgi:hypothetical protein